MKSDIKSELKDLIDQETDLKLLETIKTIFTEEYSPEIEKKMISTAKKSEKDIKEGNLYSLEEAEERLNKNLDL